MVATPYGQVPIETLRIGDEVCTFDGVDTVTGTGSHIADVNHIVFSDSSEITCTPNHPFAVNNHTCFLRADMLTYDSVLVTIGEGIWGSGEHRIQQRKVSQLCAHAEVHLRPSNGVSTRVKVSTVQGHATRSILETLMGLKSMAYGFLGRGETNTTGLRLKELLGRSTSIYGSPQMGQRRAGTRSTILTETQQTTKSVTSSVSSHPTTPVCTSQNASLMEPSMQLSLWNWLGKQLRFGISHLREGIGIDAMRLSIQRLGRQKSTYAAYADRSMSEPSESTCATTAPQRVIRNNSAGKERVYNITTGRTHVYYANGFLVHNCDSAQYLCLHADGGAVFGAKVNKPAARAVSKSGYAYS